MGPHKIILGLALLALSSFVLSGCRDSGAVPAMPEAPAHAYLSISCTTYNNGTDTDEGMTTSLYTYDIESKTLEKSMAVPYTSQYPLGVVSLADKKVYYSAKAADGKGDQLYSYDMESKEERQLTDSLFAINYIIPHGDKIILSACPKHQHFSCDKLVIYDKNSGQLQIFAGDDDSEVWLIACNPQSDRIYFTFYDMAANRKHNKESVGKGPPTPEPETIAEVAMDLTEYKPLFVTDNQAIPVMSCLPTGEVYYLASNDYFDAPRTYHILDTKSGQSRELETPRWGWVSDIKPSPDGKGLYVLGELSDGSQSRGIFYYDLETQESTTIMDQQDGFINNFVLLQY